MAPPLGLEHGPGMFWGSWAARAPLALSRPDQKLSDGQFVSPLAILSFLHLTNDGHGIRPKRADTQSPLR